MRHPARPERSPGESPSASSVRTSTSFTCATWPTRPSTAASIACATSSEPSSPDIPTAAIPSAPRDATSRLFARARERHAQHVDILVRRKAPAVHEASARRPSWRLQRGDRFAAAVHHAEARGRSAPALRECDAASRGSRCTRPPILITRIIAGSPIVSSSPSSRFAFCTACPAAPFTRLSIAATMISVGARTPAAMVGGDSHDVPMHDIAQRGDLRRSPR